MAINTQHSESPGIRNGAKVREWRDAPIWAHWHCGEGERERENEREREREREGERERTRERERDIRWLGVKLCNGKDRRVRGHGVPTPH